MVKQTILIFSLFAGCTLVLELIVNTHYELIILNFLMCCYKNQEQPPSPGSSAGRDEAPSNDIILDKEVLNMEPVLKAQPKLLSLDDKILLNVARANVLSQITVSILVFHRKIGFKAISYTNNKL